MQFSRSDQANKRWLNETDSQSQSNEYPNEPIDLDHMSPDSPDETDDSLPLEDLETSDVLPWMIWMSC